MLSSALHAATTAPVPLAQVFGSELVGTALLTLLGCGVVANVVLTKTLGNSGGWLLINVGWGFAVLAGVYASFRSGAHINPAVTLGILASGASEYAPGVAVTAGSTVTYVLGQLLGAFLGAVVCWLAYKKHFDEHSGAEEAADVDLRDDVRGPSGSTWDGPSGGTSAGPSGTGARGVRGDVPDDVWASESGGTGVPSGRGGRAEARLEDRRATTSVADPAPGGATGEPTAGPREAPAGAADKLGVFCTGPAIPAPVWNVVTEVIGTFVLVLVVLLFGKTPSGLGPAAVAFLVVGLGASLGGPTGYAINPARDLGPRIAHALLPIRGKGGSNWGYAWVPVVGPLLGGLLAAMVFRVMT